MRGSKRERKPGVWELRVHTGGDRYRSRTFRGDATRADRALIAQVETETARPAGADTTVADWMERWYARARPGWASPATAVTTRQIIDGSIVPDLGDIGLHELTRADVDAWIGKLSATGLGAGTIRRRHGILHAALESAVALEVLDRNPSTKARLPKVTRREFPDVPVAKVLDALDAADINMYTFLYIAWATGARRGQVCGLQWADVGEDHILFARSVARAQGGVAVKETKTGRVNRVAVDPGTIDALAAYRTHREEQALATLADRSFIFADDPAGATPWHPDTPTRAWRKLAKRVGLDGVRLHDLRHAHATLLIEQGVDVVTVATRLQHANPSMTLKVYAHPVAAADRGAADVVSRALQGPQEPPPDER